MAAVAEQPAAANTQTQMGHLYEILEKSWDAHYVKFTRCQVKSESGQILSNVDTSFCLSLKDEKWICSFSHRIDVAIDGQTARMDSTVGLSQGRDLYLDHHAIKSLMGHHVSYMRGYPNKGSGFATFLGVKFSVSIEEVSTRTSTLYVLRNHTPFF